jgi:uncharacterized membrane protein YqgA involved in biofilm formation
MKFGMFAIGIVAIIQGIAWICGQDGMVFALTSAVIGGVTGTILGFSVNKLVEK